MSDEEWMEMFDRACEKSWKRGHELRRVYTEDRACLECLAVTEFLISEEKKKYGGTFLYKKCMKCGKEFPPEYVARRYDE